VGIGQALWLLLSGDYIDAKEALRIGLVNRVVTRGELLPIAEAMARGIKSHDSMAVQRAKEAVKRGADLSLGQGLALETRIAGSVRRIAGKESPVKEAALT